MQRPTGHTAPFHVCVARAFGYFTSSEIFLDEPQNNYAENMYTSLISLWDGTKEGSQTWKQQQTAK